MVKVNLQTVTIDITPQHVITKHNVTVPVHAAGKIIVATQFPHAVEVLASGCGLTVPHEDPVAMSQAIGPIVADPARARRMSRSAHHVGRPMLWSAVADSTATLIIDSTVNARNRECVPGIPVLKAGSNDAIHARNLSQVRSAYRSSRRNREPSSHSVFRQPPGLTSS